MAPVRTLSSPVSFLYKFVFSGIWISGFGAGAIGVLMQPRSSSTMPSDARMIFPIAWVIGSAFIYWSCIRLKKVSIDGSDLLVSNYLKTIRIPLENVEHVSGTLMLSPEHLRVTALIAPSTRYRFIFLPPIRFSFGFTEHPLAAELRSMTAAARAARGPQSAA